MPYPEEYRQNFSASTVGTALKKLVDLGLVETVEPKRTPKSVGRPPAQAYKAVTLGVARKTVITKLDSYRKAILQSLDAFGQIEEGRNMREDKLPEAELT